MTRASANQILRLLELGNKASHPAQSLTLPDRKRLEVARALATRPKLLLLDEVMAGLRPVECDRMVAILTGLNRDTGLTILLITHEMSVVAEICRRVAVMEHGRIIETGDVLDVFVRPRTPTGRALVTTATGGDPPEVVMKRLISHPVPGGGIVLRIVFRGSLADQPVISQLSRRFGTDMNLLHGRLDAIDDASFGVLVAEVTGPPAGIQATIAFLHSNRLDVEVLGYVAPSLRATG